MRISKYLDLKFGNWTCTHVGVARVQATKTKQKELKTGRLIKSKRPGHQSYYYIFERPTSDGKANKMIRLNKSEAAKLYRGNLDIEEIAKKRLARANSEFTSKVSYQFIKSTKSTKHTKTI